MRTTKSLLDSLQQLNLAMTREIQALNLPKLGPSFMTLPADQVQAALVAHRLVKKMSPPSSSKERAQKSVLSMLEYDASGPISFEPASMNIDCFSRHILYNARLTYHKIFRNYKINYQDFDFPSGESYDSAQGDVSLVAKLRDPKHWKVTRDCADDFIKIIFNNLHLKRSAMSHVRAHPFYIKHKGRIDKYLWDLYKDEKKASFLIFSVKVREFLLTVIPGARLSTVPKDQEVDRVIQVEAFGNMCVQRAHAHSHIKLIEKFFGYKLEHSQILHQQLIADKENATIDWRNASNSNWTAVLRFFYPESVFNKLLNSRSPIVTYSGEYSSLNMIAPMGNGFTFEVMTTFLLILAREFDSCASVFGDDVIIHNDCAHNYIQLLSYMGWTVNDTKSFISSSFRESCGAFYHDEIGYLKSFDLWFPENMMECMINTNKLYVLLQSRTSHELYDIIEKYWMQMRDLFPAYCRRVATNAIQSTAHRELIFKHSCEYYPIVGERLYRYVYLQRDALDLTGGILVNQSQYNKSFRTCLELQHIKRKLHNRLMPLLENLCYSKYDIVVVPLQEPIQYSFVPIDNIKSRHWIAYHFTNGRVVTPTKRKYKGVFELRCVLPGFSLTICSIRTIKNQLPTGSSFSKKAFRSNLC